MTRKVAIARKDGFMDDPHPQQFCIAGKIYHVELNKQWLVQIRDELGFAHTMSREFAEEYFEIKEAAGMDFGLAVQYLKQGYRVARDGWNGKGMWLMYITEQSYEVHNDILCAHVDSLRGWIAMKTVDAQLVPWTASQTDILANDWKVITHDF